MRVYQTTIIATLLLFPQVSHAGRSCKKAEREECAAQLADAADMDATELQQLLDRHLPYGVPQTSGAQNERLLVHDAYIVNYDEDLRTATWVGYRLRDLEIVSGPRVDCFQPDPRISAEASATLEDYKYDNGVYDRGHLVPRADMNRSLCTMINTFLLSNMAPQHDAFNRCQWRWLEDYGRDWATLKTEVYVFSGAVFDHDHDEARDDDQSTVRIETKRRVALPSAFFKVFLYARPSGYIESLAFLLPHEAKTVHFSKRDEFLKDHIVSIAEIEKQTGIDFLPSLKEMNTSKYYAVRKKEADNLWPTEERSASFLDDQCNTWAGN